MDLKRKAIRVGIAASLCMLISNLLKLKYPFFALLPAVMPISTFFGETIKFGLNRIIGSTIGAVIGVILVIIPSQNVLIVGIGVVIIIYVCDYLKWDSTTSIACLVFASIAVGVKGPAALDYSVHRLLDTFIGIAVTTIVNNYIFNPDISRLLKKQASEIQKDLLNIANVKDFSEDKSHLENMEKQLNGMKDKLAILGQEFKFSSKSSPIKDELQIMIYTLGITLDQIKAINYISNSKNKDVNRADTEMVIDLHKDIFFNEMENLNKILSDI